MNVNKAIIVGRLTGDAELRTTQSGQSVATFRLATNSFWTDKAGQRQERTEFHAIVLWGKLADIAGKYLVKGQECYVEGRLETRSYTRKDNVEMKVTEIVGENIQLGARPTPSHTHEYAPPAARTATPDQPEEIPTIDL